jgi:hypothetical protein
MTLVFIGLEEDPTRGVLSEVLSEVLKIEKKLEKVLRGEVPSFWFFLAPGGKPPFYTPVFREGVFSDSRFPLHRSSQGLGCRFAVYSETESLAPREWQR